jgi:hypothetical protein
LTMAAAKGWNRRRRGVERMIRNDSVERQDSTDVERRRALQRDHRFFYPVNLKSLDDLDAYVEYCKQYFAGESDDARFLRWLIDREKSRCVGRFA